jgi:simple sugar transport system permease protein
VLKALELLGKGALGSRFALSETLTRATPLIFTGLAATAAFQARFWNIGMEGQLYLGAVATVLVGSGVIVLPPLLMIPLLLAAGALTGAALLLISAALKLKLGVDEIVTTLLLNFVVLLFVSLLLDGPLKDPMSMGWPQSSPVIDQAAFPIILAGTRLHAGLIFGLIAAALLWFVNERTTLGYEIKALGLNARAATVAGIPVTRTIIGVAVLSGGLAGLAGVGEVAGVRGSLSLDLSPGFGYTGIVVAMLGQLHPAGCVLAAIFVAGIFVGADAMSRALSVPTYLADVIVSVSLVAMLIALFLTRYRLRMR